jgi:hypothetical protein
MVRTILLAALLLQAPAGRLALEGQVVTLNTNLPVPRARVVVGKVGGALEDYRTAVADANGRFSFRDLTAGSYRVFTEKQGYLRGEHGRRLASGNGTPVWMVEGQSTRITVTMIPTGVISGRVLDGERPAPGVLVRALRASFFDGQRSLAMAAWSRSDDLGEYRLFGLAPGIYYVTGAPPDGARIEGDIYVVPTIPSNANKNQREIRTAAAEALAKDLVDADAFDNSVFVPAFFPGTTDETTAAAIEVDPGATVSGIDILIARSPTVRVRGRVIDATGQPAHNVTVSVASRERTSSIAAAATDAAGAFELAAVPPGRYELSARTTTTTNRLFGTASIDVQDRDLEHVDITVRPGTTLKGKVTFRGAPSDGSLASIVVQLNGTTGFGYTALNIPPDGTFSIQNVEPREYRVRFAVRGGFRAAESARLGAEDVTGRPFRFGPEFADTLLELVLNLAVGGIDVSAVDTSQRTVAGVTVALVPDATRRNQSSLYRTASTDEFGRARLDDVPPGDYLLLTDDVDPPTWQDPEVIRRYEAGGTRVRVVENARQSVTLRIR